MEATSAIELSQQALNDNLEFMRSLIGDDCTLSSVVKGNAYGHGLRTFVPMALRAGIGHFSVFSAEEAAEVHAITGGTATIMIMGYVDQSDLEWVLERDIEFFVFDMYRMDAALVAARKTGRPARIHLEADTGLNRTGFDKKGLLRAAAFLKRHPDRFEVKGLCTHYAGAESVANHVRVQKQIRTFNQFYKALERAGIRPEKRHTACSAAAMSYPQTRMDMVRIGIMQYGFWPSRETFINFLGKRADKSDPLRRVITWKSRIMSMHRVKAGEFIGYGTSYMAESEMRVAVVPVGYAQGYSRSLSNQGRILIRGHRVSVIGLVNMNMLLADVTYVPDAAIGDEVVLIGNQQQLSISISSFSEITNQLNYELLTRLPRDIPRSAVA